MTIELSNPFNYDNNKNLVIAIDENTIGHHQEVVNGADLMMEDGRVII